jgi:hypothetical protein
MDKKDGQESRNMTARTGERGQESLEKNAGAGQLERTVVTGQPWQDSHERKETTGLQINTGLDSWDRTSETG